MKKLVNLFLISAACLLAFACAKDGEEGSAAGTAVLGVSIKDLPAVVEVPEHQSQSYEIVVVSNPGPSAMIQVTLGTDASLVEKYNAANGTAYELLPSAAYELPASALMVMRFNKTSAPGSIRFKGAGCVKDKVYVLPVVVASVKGTAAYEAPETRVAYVLFRMLEPQMAGLGTQEDPYLITSAEEFNKLGNVLKDGEKVYVKLTADIDYNGAGWSQANATGRPIVLDGDNHVVKNVVAEHALFHNIEGTVKNLTFDNVVISAGAEQAGILSNVAGVNEGENVTIQNVTVRNSSITNTGYTGGLVGRITRGIVDRVNIDCTVSGAARVGGTFGHAISSTITNSTVAGSVIGSDFYVGGLVGLMYECTVKNCSVSADVTCESLANAYARVGGLVGEIFKGALIEKCHATGKVVGKGYYGGGLVGVINVNETVDGTTIVGTVEVKQSYSTGDVSLIRATNNKDAGAGGLVGCVSTGKAVITDCYATGAVEADRYSAGFVGDLYENCEVVITNGFTNGDLTKLGPDANGKHSDGVVVGSFRDALEEGDNETTIKVTCKGFVAWNTLDTKKFVFRDLVPSTGNYFGAEETISSQARKFGWDESIWDLSGDTPKLK